MKIFDLRRADHKWSGLKVEEFDKMVSRMLHNGPVWSLSQERWDREGEASDCIPQSYHDHISELSVYLVDRSLSGRYIMGSYIAGSRCGQQHVYVPEDQHTPDFDTTALEDLFEHTQLRDALRKLGARGTGKLPHVGLPDELVETIGSVVGQDMRQEKEIHRKKSGKEQKDALLKDIHQEWKRPFHDRIACYVPEKDRRTSSCIFLWMDKIEEEFEKLHLLHAAVGGSHYMYFVRDVLAHEIGHALMDNYLYKTEISPAGQYIIEEPLAVGLALQHAGLAYRCFAQTLPFPYIYGLNFIGDSRKLKESVALWRMKKRGVSRSEWLAAKGMTDIEFEDEVAEQLLFDDISYLFSTLIYLPLLNQNAPKPTL